jgi:hypothetical protein
MGGNANVSVAKQSAQEVGQCGSFSDEQWYATSTGKRRRLAGADHGQSCTGSVLPGNGGIGVPNTSFENVNHHRRKGCHTYEPTIRGNDDSNGGRGSLVEKVVPVNVSATNGKRSFMYASGNNRVEGNLSNQRSLMVPSCPRENSPKSTLAERGVGSAERQNAGGRDVGQGNCAEMPSPKRKHKHNAVLNAKKNLRKKMRKAALKSQQTIQPLQMQVMSVGGLTDTAITPVAVPANEPKCSVRILNVVRSIPDSQFAGPGAIQAVGPCAHNVQVRLDQQQKRFVQQSALDSAAAQARLLAMVSSHAHTVQGRANRVAIAKCDRNPARCRSLQTGSAHDVEAVVAPEEGGVEEGLPTRKNDAVVRCNCDVLECRCGLQISGVRNGLL